ncbi:MAG: hypothetical protein EZS28_024273 [Streblomastix strix]|uniref:Uncharacterized protein n=1 Tax=Streblomastix strix TaxID=222440 RepID=A0A5J4VCE7_9EUKA|nr:MAG: hypothetical protein EZS28_024273 [Streblomastix strix]
MGRGVPDWTGNLKPREISVEISPWNREEERADEDGSSADGRKDRRIDIQRERQWNGRKDQKIYINMETHRERRFHKHWILSEIQRLKQLIEIRRKQNDDPIQRKERRKRNRPRNVDRRNGIRNCYAYLAGSSEMVELYIPDKETQWNLKKDSGCEEVVQRNRRITLHNA